MSHRRSIGARLAAVDLDDHRVALAAAGADRRHAEPAAAAAQLVAPASSGCARRCPDRVAERDRAAVDVHLRLVHAEHAHRVERDRGERLVDLEQVDVVDRQARPSRARPWWRSRACAPGRGSRRPPPPGRRSWPAPGGRCASPTRRSTSTSAPAPSFTPGRVAGGVRAVLEEDRRAAWRAPRATCRAAAPRRPRRSCRPSST